jgi:hypothetical protein
MRKVVKQKEAIDLLSNEVKSRIKKANPNNTVILFNQDLGLSALEVELGVLSSNMDEMFVFGVEDGKLYRDLYTIFLSDYSIAHNASISPQTYKDVVRHLSGNKTDDKMFESTIPTTANGVRVLSKDEMEEYTSCIFQHVRAYKNQITGEIHKMMYNIDQWVRYNPKNIDRNRFLQVDMDAILDKINKVGGFDNLDIFTKKLLKVYKPE